MRAAARLVLRDVEALLVVLGDHRLTEGLGAVGVGALTDHQEAGVLIERDSRRTATRSPKHAPAYGFSSRHRARPPRSGGCARAEPQQPPTNDRSNSSTKPASADAMPAGSSGYTAIRSGPAGSPAFGMTDTGSASACEVAQALAHLVRPGRAVQARSASTPSGSKAASAAPISTRSSISRSRRTRA